MRIFLSTNPFHSKEMTNFAPTKNLFYLLHNLNINKTKFNCSLLIVHY